jgi:hypothetical protein
MLKRLNLIVAVALSLHCKLPTPPSLALEVNCPTHVTSGLVLDRILIVPEPSRLPSALPRNNSPANIAMTVPVDEKNPALAGLVHPAKLARLMINMLRTVEDLVMHRNEMRAAAPPDRCLL